MRDLTRQTHRGLPFDGSHEQDVPVSDPSDQSVSDQVLKAYASGRLGPAEAEALERAAAADPQLAAEIALVRGMMQAGDLALADRAAGEFGWARLSRSLDADRRRRPSEWVGARVPVWQAAAAVLAAVVVWQLAVAPQLAGEEDEPAYAVASEAPAVAHAAQVTFRPAATEAAIRAALLEVGGQIRDGPSAVGVYRVAFEDAAALADGVIRLRAKTDLVESAEPD
jgi:anti-sigma factor RsiW